MRKIINDPETFVDEVLDGILLAHPTQLRTAGTEKRAIIRTDAPAAGRVGIVTGGGSGHLPFFLGYVGQGLCSAVVVGNVFSSPSAAQIYAASRAVASDAGLLYLYGNYGGDVYNFDMAADLCHTDGIAVRTVLGADDLLSAPADRASTRRGVAGLVLVYKVAGAAADRLYSLDEVTRIAQKAADATRTVGVGLSPTILPAAGEATFSLNEGEMEIGVGIHGEKGAHRGPLETADEITDRFLNELGSEIPFTDGSRVAVLVNGLGATPLEELYLIYGRVHRVLAARGVSVGFHLVGEFVTSLEMAGASLSIMALDDELEALLEDPAASPFFRHGSAPEVDAFANEVSDAAALSAMPAAAPVGLQDRPSVLRRVLLDALPRMAAHSNELRDLDAALGDGDLGITVGSGSQASVDVLTELPENVDALSALRAVAAAFAAANPSTFAALVGSGLLGGVETLTAESDLDSADAVAAFLQATLDRISERGGAQLGDKTLLDTLNPVIRAIAAGTTGASLRDVAADAVTASTALESKRGRAAWQQERSIGQADPGSVAVQRLVDEIVATLGL